MKAIAIAIGARAAAAAASASADVYYGSRAYYSPEPSLNSNIECWNPHARHFTAMPANSSSRYVLLAEVHRGCRAA